jgi:hypothetical protein
MKAVPKINVVILSEAKNLFFYRFLKEEILRTYVLRMTQKGKLTRILEHSYLSQYKIKNPLPCFNTIAKGILKF